MNRRFTLLCLLALSVIPLAGSETGHAKDEKAASEEHGAAATKSASPKPAEAAKADPKAQPTGTAALAMPVRSSHYVHSWLAFPPILGRQLPSGQKYQFQPQQGRALVLVFLASWCLPCQQMVKPLQEMQKKFSPRYTDFIFAFAHDTEADAKGFIAQYKLENEVILGSAALLETFHQPELPSIYIGDRYNWMVMRKLNTQASDLEEIDRFLEVHTAF